MKKLNRRGFLKLLGILGIGAVASQVPVNEYDEFFGEEFHITHVEPFFKESPRTIYGTQATLYWGGKEIDLAHLGDYYEERGWPTYSGEKDGAVYTVTLHAEGVINDDFDFDALFDKTEQVC